MSEYTTVILVPRAYLLDDVLAGLAEFVEDGKQVAVSRAQRSVTSLAQVAVRVARDRVPHLDRLRAKVDLMLVRGIHEALQAEYLRLAGERLSAELPEGSVLYTPTGVLHQGKMSSSSGACYHLRLERPIPGGRPAEVMVQSFEAGKKSTYHRHHKSIEHWLALAGKTILHCTDKLRHSTIRTIAESGFQTALPQTAHQLQTLEEGGLNILCIEPYHGLDDHEYMGGDAPTLYR